MTHRPKPAVLVLASVLFSVFSVAARPQPPAYSSVLRGEVTDPSGAVVPGAHVTLSRGSQVRETETQADGRFAFHTLAAGSYTLRVTAKGFAPLSRHAILVAQGKTRELNLPLAIAVQRQTVTVNADIKSVGVSPDQNSSAMVFKGTDLNALSDDPDELEAELAQLAGAVAGPNGGQIYVDGFAGGQLPPKSSILEIRVNQNPFSSEYDRIGYGRVEIITKPGSQKLHGSLLAYGNSSALNTANPLVSDQPPYYMYSYSGDIEGPLGKHASFLLSGFKLEEQNQNMVDAVNPQNPAAKVTQAVANPTSVIIISPRVDVQLGSHTLSFLEFYRRSTQTGYGAGGINLASQALGLNVEANVFQFSDTHIVSAKVLSELHAGWRRVLTDQIPASLAPEVIVSGAFVGGGNLAGTGHDHQDNFDVREYATAVAGNHTLRMGVRAHIYRDVNYSAAGSNGVYTFSNLAAYQARTPSEYSAAVINNPTAKVLLADGSIFFQDDWRVKSNLMLGVGIRYEAQNWISDYRDWAPRLALAWSPGKPSSTAQKTVIRAGYGWFYDRFTVPTAFTAFAGAPYVVQTVHDNRVNQQTWVVTNPSFFNPAAPATTSEITSSATAVPSFHSVDPHLRAAVDMQAGAGIDRQFTRALTANVTYLFTQGVHQYLSNNVTAPAFNTVTYSAAGPSASIYNYQYQSGGFFKQHQFIATGNIQTRQFVVNASYVFNVAKSDSEGADTFVSVAQNPGFDYGRASFGVRHRFSMMQSYTAPYGFVFATVLAAQSGTPFNITTGSDLTGNNQFNARPGYGTCGLTGVLDTPYGCLDPNPRGKGERIVPFGAGVGPANLLVDLRVSKTFGIGPRTKAETAGSTLQADDSVSGRGFGGQGAAIRLNAGAPRRYQLTLVMGASNLFNVVNWGTPNGVLSSPIFNQSQSLAGGAFANPTPGNRAFVFQTSFSF